MRKNITFLRILNFNFKYRHSSPCPLIKILENTLHGLTLSQINQNFWDWAKAYYLLLIFFFKFPWWFLNATKLANHYFQQWPPLQAPDEESNTFWKVFLIVISIFQILHCQIWLLREVKETLQSRRLMF